MTAYTTQTSTTSVSKCEATGRSGLTVHVPRCHGLSIWKRIHNQREQRPHEQNDVCEEAEFSEPEWTRRDCGAASNKEAYDWNSVAQV